MSLRSFETSNQTKLKRINKFLKENFGVQVSSKTGYEELLHAKEKLISSINKQKVNENAQHNDPTLNRDLLILSGINLLLEGYREVNGKSYHMSSKINSVIQTMADFCLSKMELGDSVEDAIQDAMKSYRSSKYRFPDIEIEHDLRKAIDERSGVKVDRGVKYSKELAFLRDNKERVEEMRKNLIKDLRNLMESEVEQAEVLIAAKGFGQEIQDMIEKVGRLQNEDLGPVVDQMRDTYGPEMAERFLASMQDQMNGVLNTLRDTKASIDDAVISIADGQVPGGVNDMDVDLDPEADLDLDIDDADIDVDADAEADADIEDPAMTEPLGRPAKESREVQLLRKIKHLKEKHNRLKKILESKKAKKK